MNKRILAILALLVVFSARLGLAEVKQYINRTLKDAGRFNMVLLCSDPVDLKVRELSLATKKGEPWFKIKEAELFTNNRGGAKKLSVSYVRSYIQGYQDTKKKRFCRLYLVTQDVDS